MDVEAVTSTSTSMGTVLIWGDTSLHSAQQPLQQQYSWQGGSCDGSSSSSWGQLGLMKFIKHSLRPAATAVHVGDINIYLEMGATLRSAMAHHSLICRTYYCKVLSE